MARIAEGANFAGNLRYDAGVAMYFPAGIPFVAVVALVVWSIREEAKRAANEGSSKRG